MSSPGSSSLDAPFRQKDFFYTVFNLPNTASDHEIRERYRNLSVLFHPDKQRDERTKGTASKRFLEIQKAYEVLSDSFSRAVYDIYGSEGLGMTWSPEVRSKSGEELRKILDGAKEDRQIEALEARIRPQGRMLLSVDARSLFEPTANFPGLSWKESIPLRLSETRFSVLALKHVVQLKANENTKVSMSSNVVRGPNLGMGGNITGTVRHQYSPRLNFMLSTSILRPRILTVKSTYRNDWGTITAETFVSPSLILPPPFTLAYSRRLFRDSLKRGILAFHSGAQPSLSIDIVSPSPFGRADEYLIEMPSGGITSTEGLGIGVGHWTYGVKLAGLDTSLKAEWGVAFTEVALQASVAFVIGVTGGVGWLLSGSWGDEQGGMAASIGLNPVGVDLRLEIFYLGQQFVVPVSLADDYDLPLASFTAVLPSAAFVLAYHFILKPRRRRQRLAILRKLRKEMQDERSSVRREVEETIALLKETARKHMLSERAKEGLVIVEAAYGPTDPDFGAKDLIVDVTIPVQALVHNSQLYIPGHRQKSGLQGFYDPAPSFAKALRIRYLFDGREHYAEVPDQHPIVLPLEEHLVRSAI